MIGLACTPEPKRTEQEPRELIYVGRVCKSEPSRTVDFTIFLEIGFFVQDNKLTDFL